MILVIGSQNCSRCGMTKLVLDNKKVEYKYVMLDDLQKEEQDKYMKMASDAGMMNFPIIIKDNEVVTLQSC